MTLQASGDIAATDLIAEFGGTGMLSEYYRAGGLVPSTRPVDGYYNIGPISDPEYSLFVELYYVRQVVATGNYTNIEWHGSASLTSSNFTLPHISGGYQYNKSGSGTVSGAYRYYAIVRATATYVPPSTQNINTSVPTLGDISLTDFYSATAS